MIAQKDLAAKLGISRSAVSSILQGGERAAKFRPEMRRRVLEAAAQYGYQRNELANAIRSGHNRMFGFVTQSVSHSHVGLLLNGVLEIANDNDYAVRILSTYKYNAPEQIARQVIGQCLAGVIIYDISDMAFLTALYELLQHHGIPIIYAGGSSPIDQGIRIESDVAQGGKIAFDHLYGLGHRNFLLACSYDWADYSQKLLRGFMEQAGQAAETVRCRTLTSDDELDAEQVLNAMGEDRLTACLCNTAHLTVKLLTQALNRGIKVPDDISIMGRGNMAFCDSTVPGLTMLDEKLETIGRQATESLLRTLREDETDRSLVKIPHQLVIRQSTAKRTD